MHTRLVLEDRVRAGALDGDRDVLDAARVGRAHRQLLGPESAALGVLDVDLEKLSREQRRLFPARGGADLEDHVLVVVGIRLDHRLADLRLQGLHLPLGLVQEAAQILVVFDGQRSAASSARAAASRHCTTRPITGASEDQRRLTSA